jgi:mono/diheme cytochrome c family protein
MKKITYIALVVAAFGFISCGGPKRKPGRVYMPDMSYSRAYESYPNLDPTIFTDQDSMAGSRIYYDRKPVNGTVKRGQEGVFHFENDTTQKKLARTVNNPIDTTITKAEKEESVRLFNIYCAICHGTDMKGNGPLVASGKYSVAAANLTAEKFTKPVYGDGEVFHSITYGKGAMGGYASQLNNKQRWMIVNYIRSKQAPATTTTATPAAETAKKN